MDSQLLKKGTKLQNGKYTIVSVLGQGGFGITYKAMMNVTLSDNLGSMVREVPVAIKEFFMSDSCVRDEKTCQVSVPSIGSQEKVELFRKKFIKEANNLASMDHPNIVKVIGVFKENGTDYYVMEFLEGGSLKDLINKGGAFDEEKAVRFTMLIGNALSYMHTQKQMCHFDVKPGNIMIDKDGIPKLIDFGISKSYDNSGNQMSATPVGISSGYSPLEQYQQAVQEFTPQSDIYSLGATFYYMLTGLVPPEATIVFNQGLPALTPKISDQTQNAIHQAMQPRKDDRPQTMAAFLQLLAFDDERTIYNDSNPIVEDKPISPVLSGTNPDQKEETKQKKPSKKMIVSVASIVLIVVIGVMIVLWGRSGSFSTEKTENVEAMIENEVQNLSVNSEIGDYSYNGPIDNESKPHGIGEAMFSDGRHYKGPFNHGILEGDNAYFVFGNGDFFEGSFSNNLFKEGKYTKKDGSYYQGTFVNGNTDQGNWYNKDGKLLD